MRRHFLGLLAAAVLASCSHAVRPQPQAGAEAGAGAAAIAHPNWTHPAWSKTAVIYEVNVRQYTPEGTFAAFQKHLPRLKALGVDILWLMPVQPIGKANRKGPLGSYYSVADYRGVNPEFGTAADFRALADAVHAQGMKLILDWVPNHSAFDNPWIKEHPDWYVHRPDGSISFARDNEGRETDWTDVAELNYDNPAMRQAMIGAMRFWLDSMGVDGFREDVAGGVPYDFWAQARAALQAGHPGLFMLAEAENPRMQASFDATYGWEFHHLLNQVAQGKQPTSALNTYFARQDSLYARDAFRMYFTSNHDENSWNGTEFERMGPNHLPAFILAATVQQSFPLLYTGQEASLNRRLRFFEKDTVTWADTTLTPWYRRVFELRHTQPALANGAWGAPQVPLQNDGGDRVFAFTRTQGSNTVMVVVNFGDTPVTFSYSGLPHPGTYTRWFVGQQMQLSAAGQLEIPAHGYRVLVR